IVLFAWLVSACSRISTIDTKLVGTWRSYSVDAACDTTFRTDHSLYLACEKGQPARVGRWRVDGDDLVFEMDAYVNPPTEQVPQTSYRQKIVDLTQEKLVLSN